MIPLWNRCVRNTPRRCWNDLCQPLGLLPTAVGAPSPEVTRPGVGSLGWGQAAQCRVGLGGALPILRVWDSGFLCKSLSSHCTLSS